MKLKKFLWSRLTLALSVAVLAGCGSKKDVSEQVTIEWVIPSTVIPPQADADKSPNSFRRELADWFSPYRDAACPDVRIYPQVELFKQDGKSDTNEGLVTNDPKELASTLQNGFQKAVGVKPKFEKLVDAAQTHIETLDISEKAMKVAALPSVTAEWIKDEVNKGNYSLVAYVNVDKPPVDKEKQSDLSKAGGAKVIFYADNRDSFRTELAKRVCEAKSSKVSLEKVLLVKGPWAQPPVLPSLPKDNKRSTPFKSVDQKQVNRRAEPPIRPDPGSCTCRKKSSSEVGSVTSTAEEPQFTNTTDDGPVTNPASILPTVVKKNH